MEKQESRVQKTKAMVGRPLTREQVLLKVLNGDLNRAGTPIFKAEVNRRLLALLVWRFQRLEKLLNTDKFADNVAYDPYTENPAILRAIQSLNRLLSRYNLTPRVLPDYGFGRSRLGWSMSFAEAHKTQELFEFARVRHIEEIASEGRIAYLKQCSHCRRWQFAKFSHQRFCSSACKDAFHKENADDKARRREWARKHYWILRNANVK